MENYDTLIITLSKDYERCRVLQPKVVSCLPGDTIYYVGNEEIKKLVEEDHLGKRIGCILEDSIIPYDRDKIPEGNFSEFETYGTYMTLRHPGEYRYRVWHSFRPGAAFFDPAAISEEDYEWLGKDFAAITFERIDSLKEDTRDIFDNKRYQSLFSARQMLEIAQQEFESGYIEVWDE